MHKKIAALTLALVLTAVTMVPVVDQPTPAQSFAEREQLPTVTADAGYAAAQALDAGEMGTAAATGGAGGAAAYAGGRAGAAIGGTVGGIVGAGIGGAVGAL